MFRSCFLNTLIKCSCRSQGSLFVFQNQKWLTTHSVLQSVSDGHLLNCGQLKKYWENMTIKFSLNIEVNLKNNLFWKGCILVPISQAKTESFHLASLSNSSNSSIPLQRGILFKQIHFTNRDQFRIYSLLNLQHSCNNRRESLGTSLFKLFKFLCTIII